MIKTKQPTTNEEKQTITDEEKEDILNAKIADQMLVGKKFVDNVKYALRVVRRTP